MKKNKKNMLHNRRQSIRLLNEQTPFAIRESFNQLRTNIMYTSNDSEGAPIYGITSAEMSVGKSTISSNVAISFAQTGKRVLLIDADMRRPTQHKIFNYDKKQAGLSELLAGVKNTDTEVMHSPYPGLTLITSGIIPPNPSELMHGKKFAHYLEQWKKEYDIIFVDLPPVGMVTDPLTIADHINGYVIITMANKSDAKQVNAAITTIHQVGAKVVGVVVNGTSMRNEGKSGSKYSYEYSYEYIKSMEKDD